MNYLKLKKLIANSEKKVISENNKKSLWDKVNVSIAMFALIISGIALIYTVRAYDLASDANDLTRDAIKQSQEDSKESRESSRKAIEAAQLTIEYLKSISNASNSLDKNLDDFSSKLIPLNKTLVSLINNLVSLNREFTQKQNVLTDKQLDDMERKRQNEEFLKSRKPDIIIAMDCDFTKNKYSIYAKNLGNLEARVTCLLYGWESDPEGIPRGVGETLKKNQTLNIIDFDKKGYILSDSTVSAKIKITYGSDNGSGDTTLYYVKCGVTKINER